MTLENGNVFITKEDEWSALAKIKKIVEGLGEDSYVATAFKGVWGIAEENIENDWGCSVTDLKDKCLELSDKQALYKKEAEDLKASNKGLLVDLKTSDELYKNSVDEKMQDQLNKKDFELLKLKAKLYDLMEEH